MLAETLQRGTIYLDLLKTEYQTS